MISVIIPVYNVGRYLGRCIDSVLGSAYRDFELILVDDGSTDGSPEVCGKYARLDPRVRLFSQENQGVSAARNRGLRESRGEWIVFVDGDDLISPDHLSLIAKESAHGPDLMLFDFAGSREELSGNDRSNKAYRYGRPDMPGLIERILAPRQLIEGGRINFRSSNGKAFKGELLRRQEICFAEELSYGEDKLFNLEYALCAESFAYIPVPVYFYETREGSLSHSPRPRVMEEMAALIERIDNVLSDPSPGVKDVYLDYVLEHIALSLSEVIFGPSNPVTLGERYAMCARLRKILGHHPALRQNHRLGPFERRIFLFFFRIGWYRAAHILSTAALLRRRLRKRMRAGKGGGI